MQFKKRKKIKRLKTGEHSVGKVVEEETVVIEKCVACLV